MEKNIEEALNHLLELIEQDSAIVEYKEIEKLVKNQPNLMDLVEEIKSHNKEVVGFDYYGLHQAKEQAQMLSNEKTKEFESDLLVQQYRKSLFEANDLLQHITKKLTNSVNEGGYHDQRKT
jgi:cell fate (sporulation/competence/biofilm development) regulator YmcA (YheA/YmcA/DUF963 family)